jgi:hypothetical protein
VMIAPCATLKLASAPHEISDDHRKDCAIDARTDPIQQLYAYEPIGIVRKWTSPLTELRAMDILHDESQSAWVGRAPTGRKS